MKNLITRDSLKSLIESNDTPVLIEALPEQYYDAEHLPGAINIDYKDIEAQAPELIPDKDVEVVVYCANSECKNSSIAAETLGLLGYSNVQVYLEGKKDWKEAGLPLDRKKRKIR